MEQERTEAMIAGGGPAGLAAAIALAERGARVIVLEPHVVETMPRAEMLPPAAEHIIARLGLSDIYHQSVSLGPALSLWARARSETLDHGMGLNPPAISVDRRDLDTLLRARAAAVGVEIRALRFTRVAGRARDWQVTACGTGYSLEIRARFLIDATGRPALLARRLGARLHFGPQLVARTLHVSTGGDPRLVIEATPNGWWYTLPLKEGGGTLGFVSDPGAEVEQPTLLPASRGDMADAARWDARMTRLSPVVGEGWLAVGDAAAAFDPIACQGLFNALSGGFFAGNAALDAVSGNADGPKILAALTERTAARTHRATLLHYGTARQQSPFWQRLGGKTHYPYSLMGAEGPDSHAAEGQKVFFS